MARLTDEVRLLFDGKNFPCSPPMKASNALGIWVADILTSSRSGRHYSRDVPAV